MNQGFKMSTSGRGKENSIEPKRNSISSAVLGVHNHHGVKLSLNMTSQDKRDLMLKLEEWRKERREKLIASILAKRKPIEKSKGSSVPPLKEKTSVNSGLIKNGAAKNPQPKETVFERLYKSSNRTKKLEINDQATKLELLDNQIDKNDFKISMGEHKQTNSNEVTTSDSSKEKIQSEENACKIEEKNIENSVGLSSLVTEDFNSILEKPESSFSNDLEISCKKNFTEEKTLGESLVENVVDETKYLSNGLSSEGNFNKKIVSNLENEVEKKNCEAGSSAKIFPGKNPMNVELNSQKLKKANGLKNKHDEKSSKPLRRSISMIYREKKKTENAFYRTFSEQNLSKKKFENFKTLPSAQVMYKKCTGKNNEATASAHVPTPKRDCKVLTADSLRSRLEDWLSTNGHSLEGYRHLRCFGVNTPSSVSKSAHETETTPTKGVPDDSNKENCAPLTSDTQVEESAVENWLKELYRLIVQLKYPSERCEEWLIAIRKKCSACTQLPIYWECMAALDESKGKEELTLEENQKLIMNEKDSDLISDSLTQLFDKMVIEHKKPSKSKLEKGLDPKNIFKSTTIKFALQQKNSKEAGREKEGEIRDQVYVATPVRRSSRIQTPCKPFVVSSLQTLTPELQKRLTFKPNESLLGGN